MDLGLAGKKAIVTGSTRGIGRSIVERLLAEGAEVAICARSADEVEKALGELTQKGKVIGQAVDVADAEAYKQFISDSATTLGGLDIFIPNVSAGGGEGEECWKNNFEVDVMGAVRGIEAATPYLNDSNDAAIVFIGTTAATEFFAAPQPYNALKAGLINYAKHLSQTLAPQGIRVNTVSPGPIYFEGGAWEQIKAGMPEFYDATVASIPMGRMGKPEEIANAVTFLASSAASLITGSNLIADGGLTKGVQF